MAVLRWLKAVFKQWVADVTGGVLIGALVLYSELSGVTVPPKIYGLVVAFVLFQAMFLAWREQERNALEAERDLTTLRRNAQFGLAMQHLRLTNDSSYKPSDIQFQVLLKNLLPNNAVRFTMESEVVTVNGRTLEGGTFVTVWHGLGVRGEVNFRGQKFEDVTFTERTEGTIEYCIQYGMAGDSVTYRMTRGIRLTLTKEPTPDAKPTLQLWVIVSESDVLVP